MPINITDELHAATTKGKIASAKEVFLIGDKENLQQIGEKTHQLEDSIKNIAATGGASTATAVTFDNTASGMTAVTAQAAIEELNTKNNAQDTEIAKKANFVDVTSQMQTEQKRVNTELEKKFAKADIAQELGESEEKVVSQKTVNASINAINRNIEGLEQNVSGKLNKTINDNKFVISDSLGYVIAIVDSDGVHSVDYKIGEESLRSIINGINTTLDDKASTASAATKTELKDEIERATTSENQKLSRTIDDDAFVVTDTKGFIIAKIDKDGIHAPNIDDSPSIVQSDEFLFTDANGYIVAKVNKDGITSVADATDDRIVCMVLAEAYYPIEAPTRDSNGNVKFSKVKFATGQVGSISISYTNGNSSSFSVLYNKKTISATINRDGNGNVESLIINK